MTEAQESEFKRSFETLASGPLTGAGDGELGEAFTPIYTELRGIADLHLQRGGPQTLQPTAVVNEVYLRLVGARDLKWNGHSHFMALASRAMRQVLIDHHRRKQADKRGGDWQRVTLSNLNVDATWHDLDFIALEQALVKLETLDARQANIVQLRFFAGLSVEEVATSMELSRSTVEAEWRHARAWLARELGD